MNEPRVFLRPVGNPSPLSFFALATGTLTLAAMQLGWISSGESRDVALILIGFVFPLQLVATIFAFLARDGAAAEAIGLVAGGWFAIGLITLVSLPGSTSNALGILLLAVGLLLVPPAIASFSSKAAAAAVFAAAGVRFAVTGIYELTASSSWETVAGIVGLGLFLLAFCAGSAITLTDSRQAEAGVRPKL